MLFSVRTKLMVFFSKVIVYFVLAYFNTVFLTNRKIPIIELRKAYSAKGREWVWPQCIGI